MTITVQREGRSSRPLSVPQQLAEDVLVTVNENSHAVDLEFPAERGRGDSIYTIKIYPDSFAALAGAMMHADFNAALRAFGIALQAGMPKPIKPGTRWVAHLDLPQSK